MLHLVSVYFYFTEPETIFTTVNAFEVNFPVFLLFLVSALVANCAAVSSAIQRSPLMEKNSDLCQDSTHFPFKEYSHSTKSNQKFTDETLENLKNFSSDEENREDYKSGTDADSIDVDSIDSRRTNFSNLYSIYSDEKFSKKFSMSNYHKRRHQSFNSDYSCLNFSFIPHYRKYSYQVSHKTQYFEKSFLSVEYIRKVIYDRINDTKLPQLTAWMAKIFSILIALLPSFFRIHEQFIFLFCHFFSYSVIEKKNMIMKSVYLLCESSMQCFLHKNLTSFFVGHSVLPSAYPAFINKNVCISKNNYKQFNFSSIHTSYITISNGFFSFFTRNITNSLQNLSFDCKLLYISLTSIICTFCLCFVFFHYVLIAEESFRRRLLYAKYFSKITSQRHAENARIPHFRLNKVKNILLWLNLRAHTREVHNSFYIFGDAVANFLVISTLFVFSIVFLRILLGVWSISSIEDITMFVCATCLMAFLYQFVELAKQTKKKYNPLKILYTEQINLNIKLLIDIENRLELRTCTNMLKICMKLLKDTELSKQKQDHHFLLNPIIYNLLRVTIISALGSFSSIIFPFKIKLFKAF